MSTSLPTSTGSPAWRVVVIGFVAILAVGIGIAAGAFLLANRTAAVGSGAAYVPAGAPFYFEMRLEPSVAQDGALRELLGHFPPIEDVALDQPLYEQWGARVDEMLAAEGASVTWATDVATWFDGHVAMAVTEIPASTFELPADPTAMPEVPSFVVLLGVTDVAAAGDAIERLIAEAGEDAPTFTESQHQGFTIRSADGSETGAYALTDDQVVIGPDADAVRLALDAHASGTGTAADSAEMARLTDALPADWLAFMTYDFTELVAQSLAAVDAQSPEIGMVSAFGSLLENQPLRGAMAVSASGDRLLLELATDAPTGPLAVENADRGLADEVPGDALYYSEAGNLGAALVAVIEPLKQAAASVPEGEEQIRSAEAALGADVTELVSWIDDGAMVIGYDEGEPYGGLLLVPNDVDAAQRRLGQLATFATLGAMDPSSGISVDTADVSGVTVTTIRWEDPNAAEDAMFPAPTGVVIEYAVTDDRALIGIGDRFVRRALELDAADALASQPRYVDAVAEMGGAENAGVVWMDLGGTREAIESALGPQIELFGIGYETEIQPWLLPLDRIVSVVRLEGDVLIQRSALLVE